MAARILAVCQGGPLDGQVFSVELDEETGQAHPLESRQEIAGVLYVSTGSAPAEPVADPWAQPEGSEEPPPLEHVAQVVYVPQEG